MLSYSIFLAFLFSIIRHLQFPIAVVWFNGSSFFTAISIGYSRAQFYKVVTFCYQMERRTY